MNFLIVHLYAVGVLMAQKFISIVHFGIYGRHFVISKCERRRRAEPNHKRTKRFFFLGSFEDG